MAVVDVRLYLACLHFCKLQNIVVACYWFEKKKEKYWIWYFLISICLESPKDPYFRTVCDRSSFHKALEQQTYFYKTLILLNCKVLTGNWAHTLHGEIDFSSKLLFSLKNAKLLDLFRYYWPRQHFKYNFVYSSSVFAWPLLHMCSCVLIVSSASLLFPTPR